MKLNIPQSTQLTQLGRHQSGSQELTLCICGETRIGLELGKTMMSFLSNSLFFLIEA